MNLKKSCIASVVLLGLISAHAFVSAAEKYALDEEVEVFHLNKWIPGTVRGSNKKGEVVVEFTFVNRQRQEVFAPEKVRRLYESGALCRGRLWSDASGQFKVKAALLKISGRKVELRTDQLKEVTIPIDKLSTKDQAFLKQFQQQAGLAAIPIPAISEVVEFETRHATTTTGNGQRRPAWEEVGTEKVKLNLQPDPIRKGLALTQGGVGFPSERGEKLNSLIALGGADNWMLASIGEYSERPTRLLWVSLAKQNVKRIQMLPAGEMLMDYHAASRQMLTYSKRGTTLFDRVPVLTVWQTEPAADEPRAVVSWNARLPDDKTSYPSVPWVRFASDSRIVHRTETHRILCWDLTARSLIWDTAQESFFAPEPRLSAGGKYLLIPEDAGVRIVDPANGAMLGQIPMNRCSGLAVHPAGNLVAVANQSYVYVVDLTGKQPTRRVEASSVASPITMKFDWIGDSLLSVEGKGLDGGLVLFSLDVGLPIWSYVFDSQAYWATTDRGARARSIVDDHLVYAATFEAGKSTGLAVGAVALPGEKAQAAIASVKREDFMALKSGSRIRLEVTAMDHASEIREALTKEIAANGWVYDEAAGNVLVAEYKRGEPQQIRYELKSLASGERQSQTVSVTPFLATLKVTVDGEAAWGTLASSGPPPVVSLRQADSLQGEVDRGNTPNWSFYEKIDIPVDIVDPKKRGGLGRTRVTNRGLIEDQTAR